MYRYSDVVLRRFREEDIPDKVRWLNAGENKRYLHYGLPLTEEQTKLWFEENKKRTDRWDATVLYNGKPVGAFGLIHIDMTNKQAEDYSLIGETELQGHGIGYKAGVLNVAHAFYDLGLNKVWGIIEADDTASLHRWRKMGGIVEGYLHDHVWKENHFVDAYYVAILKNNFHMPAEAYMSYE